MGVLDEIRQAIETSDVSRYRIWRDTGITQSHLCKLLSGERGMSIEAMERLADYLGLEIVIRPKRRKKRR